MYTNDRSVVKWRQNQESSDKISSKARSHRRALKASFLKMRERIVDKWWWDSLNDNEKERALYTFSNRLYDNNYTEEEIKEEIPGCLNTKRELKLKEILK